MTTSFSGRGGRWLGRNQCDAMIKIISSRNMYDYVQNAPAADAPTTLLRWWCLSGGRVVAVSEAT